MDGAPVDSHAIPLIDDGGTHQVRLVLGDRKQLTSSTTRRGAVVRA